MTEHIQMAKYTLTNDLSGNRFAVSYCSCKNLFKSVGNTAPIEKLVKDVNKQFTNETRTATKHKKFFGVLDQSLYWNGGEVFSFSVLYYSLLTRKLSVWENWAVLIEGKGTTVSLPPKRSWSSKEVHGIRKLVF